MTLLEAYQCFKNDYPDIKIGKAKFCELRPKYVMLLSDTPKNVCLCQYHENMELLLSALHKVFPDDFPLRTYELVTNCVCDDTS